jgi:hypothetical protein
MNNMKLFTILFSISIIYQSCDNIQDSRPATVKANNTVITPVGPAYTNPNCNPGVNETFCPALLNFDLSFGSSNPVISLINDKLTLTYTSSQNDVMTISLAPFIPEKSNNFTICGSASSVKNYNAYLELNGNSLGSTKLNASSTGTGVYYLHVKYNSWNSSYNLVFCDHQFKYYFNSINYIKNISGRFDFIY